MTEATAIYRAIMLAVEERRQQLNLPMWKVDELAGTQDGYYAKALHADAKSGRQAQWKTLQFIVDALWPGGIELRVANALASEGNLSNANALAFKRQLRLMTANFNPKTRRELMAELGKKSAEIRSKMFTREQRSRITKKGWRTRRRKAREKRTAAAIVPAGHGEDTSPATAQRAAAPAPGRPKGGGIAATINQAPLPSPCSQA